MWRGNPHFGRITLGIDPDNNVSFSPVVEVVTAARTLTEADSGKTLSMQAAGGAAITLPALKAGLKFRFVVGLAFATTNWVVGTAGAAAIIEGPLIVNGAAVPASNEKQINFVATAEGLGDWAEVVCDGTQWLLSGVGGGAGSITVTAP